MKLLMTFFVACLVHEWGHITAALVQGVHVKQLGVTLKGPYIRRELATSVWAEIAIAAAGPGANIVVAFLPIDLPCWTAFHLVLAVTNLVPIGRTDGARIANHLHQLYLGIMEGRG